MSQVDNETHLTTNGLNGSGKAVAAVANHAVLVLLARLMAAIGVPIVAWVFISLVSDIETNQFIIQELLIDNATQHQILMGHERRIMVLEDDN